VITVIGSISNKKDRL